MVNWSSYLFTTCLFSAVSSSS